jgi:hypothetical protein
VLVFNTTAGELDMADATPEITRGSSPKRWLLRALVVLAVLLLVVLAALAGYLASPLPARQLSALVSSYLKQDFHVEKVDRSGGTLYLRGVRLDSPRGFPRGNLLQADSIALAPSWSGLLAGRKDFRLIALDGIRINLDRDRNGVWNFAALQKLLAAQKPSPVETRIGELSVRQGAILVEGQGVQGIGLTLFDLATKGSRQSKVDLAFADRAGNRFQVKGTARLGAEPSVDLTLAAPSLDLERLALLFHLKDPKLLHGGTGSLQLATRLEKGELTANGNFLFSNLHYLHAGKPYPVGGKLELAVDYGLDRDAARLTSGRLWVKDLLQVQASGAVQQLRKERTFSLDLSVSDLDLARLSALLPETMRRTMSFSGRLGSQTLHVAGDAGKLTAVTGALQLQDASMTREGRLMIAGLNGGVGFSRVAAGVLAQGRLAVSAVREPALVQKLDLPFSLTLSHRFKPLSAQSAGFSAQVMGVSGSGRATYLAARENPLDISLKIPATRLATLQPLLNRYQVAVNSGTASLDLAATGKSAGQLNATLDLRLADLQAKRAQAAYAVKKATIAATVRRGSGHLQVQGTAQFKGAAAGGQAGDASFGYQVDDRTLRLKDADIAVDGSRMLVRQLNATLPAAQGPVRQVGVPVSLDFAGVTLKRRDLELDDLSGRVRATLEGEAAGKWLNGSAELAAGRIAWQGKPVGAPALRVAFTKGAAKGELSGKLLGGQLTGTLSGNPFALPAGSRFDLQLQQGDLAAAAPLLPKGKGVPSAGRLDLKASGAYSKAGGLTGRLNCQGSGIALAGSGGKSLLSGAGLSLSADLAGDTLSIADATVAPGPGVALKMKGSLQRPFSEQRSGRLNFALAEATAGNLVDPLINLLPSALQEATLDGRLAAEGHLDLGKGVKMLEGHLVFKDGRFELTAQKVLVAGIDGSFPFSLDLSGKQGDKPSSKLNFSRENFPKLLVQLRKAGAAGERLSVAKISLGAVELGPLTLHSTAANGTTEITSLGSSLYEGAILGRGFLTLQQGVGYRGDLLINGLSLKKLCSIFPGIEGYISGRVDGVISVSGGANGLAGLSGFTELWAREGGGEKMLVSKEFLQRLAKQKLGGFFFRSDRSYDEAEIKALMQEGFLTFESLKILHTNLFGVKDLNVTIAPSQNRIALDHLFDSIKSAATRGKAAAGGTAPDAGAAGSPDSAPAPEFKWGE